MTFNVTSATRRFFIIMVIVAALGVAVLLFGDRSATVIDSNGTPDDSSDETVMSGLLSTLRGEPCKHPRRRPMAVMLSSDPEARPLAGIAAADIVVEMPVVTGSIPRMMAVYQCEDVPEIGSVRSARHDFIPLAAAFDAMFAHWGGSIFANDVLEQGVIANIDAFPNPTGAFYRDRSRAAPHNGFTSTDNLYHAAETLGYRMNTDRQPFVITPNMSGGDDDGTLTLGYPGSFGVEFVYDAATNTYRRLRDGRSERDANTGAVVTVDTVVVLRASSRQILDDYNDVDLDGNGPAVVYRNGGEQRGWWKKQEEPLDAPLLLFDDEGNDIGLAPGRTWIAVMEPHQTVQWTGGAESE